MPSIKIQDNTYFYNDNEVINFDEGIIGFSGLRQTALVRLPDYEPFLWLTSLKDSNTRFLVLDPKQIYDGYNPKAPADINSRLNISDEADILVLTIVKISSDWLKTTVNLRAPLFVNLKTMRGAQAVLSNTNFELNQSLPQTILAAA